VTDDRVPIRFLRDSSDIYFENGEEPSFKAGEVCWVIPTDDPKIFEMNYG